MSDASGVQSDAAGVVAAFAEALNDRDADKLANLFSEDADFVDFLGHWQQDRNAVREGHQRAFAGLLASGTTTFSDLRESDLGKGITLCHAVWVIPAHDQPDGDPLPERHGIITFVLVETADGLRIRAAQNTEIRSWRE